MEDVLELYAQPFDKQHPVVCLDERPCQLISDINDPLPPQPGQIAKEDYHDQRQGTCNLFAIFQPLAGWRHVRVSERRTNEEFAHCLKYLVDVLFPDAQVIRVVLDNLNIHSPAALYQTFPPAQARRIWSKLEFHYTPKHGSWLNMVEIELSILARQCLKRRLADQDTLQREVEAWERQRNQQRATVDWRFSASDARVKLQRLYPELHPS